MERFTRITEIAKCVFLFLIFGSLVAIYFRIPESAARPVTIEDFRADRKAAYSRLPYVHVHSGDIDANVRR